MGETLRRREEKKLFLSLDGPSPVGVTLLSLSAPLSPSVPWGKKKVWERDSTMVSHITIKEIGKK